LNHQVLRSIMLDDALFNPFKQVRHAIGELVNQIFANLWLPQRPLESLDSPSAVSVVANQFVENMVVTLQEFDQQQDPRAIQLHETVLHWIFHAFTYGDTKEIVIYFKNVGLLSSVFSMVRDPVEDLSKLAASSIALVSQAYFPHSILRPVFDSINYVARSPHWNIRKTVPPFLQILVFNHRFILPQLSQVCDLIGQLLVDSQLEVRELARVSLASIATTLEPQHIQLLEERFTKLSSTPLPKSKQAESSEALCKRHGGVLGLCGLILSCPYSIPLWLPQVLVRVAAHSSDPAPIKDSVHATFAEFWRTHYDEWEAKFISKFTSEQLLEIENMKYSHSAYYA